MRCGIKVIAYKGSRKPKKMQKIATLLCLDRKFIVSTYGVEEFENMSSIKQQHEF
jgi:hypothetical protein